MRGHPVFIAQHATATCCRGCIQKWHRIEKGRALSDDEIKFVVELVMGWTEGANKWESTENAGFSHVINKKLESISLNKFKMRSKLRFSI